MHKVPVCGHELRFIRGLPEADPNCLTCAMTCLSVLQYVGAEMESPHRYALTGISEEP